jgi:uncharacterized repeat protein (TIGR01451 family)
MKNAHLSLCRRRSGLPAWALRAFAACGGALAVAMGPPAAGQAAAWGASRGIALEPLLEKLVESKGPSAATRYDLAAGVVTDSGEQFVLTLRFANATGATVDGVRITGALPASLRYVGGTATGPGGLVLFSVDGGQTFATEKEFAARPQAASEPNAYTHVRWVLDAPLEAGATGFVRLRAASR